MVNCSESQYLNASFMMLRHTVIGMRRIITDLRLTEPTNHDIDARATSGYAVRVPLRHSKLLGCSCGGRRAHVEKYVNRAVFLTEGSGCRGLVHQNDIGSPIAIHVGNLDVIDAVRFCG
jgi:hypothetical protein